MLRFKGILKEIFIKRNWITWQVVISDCSVAAVRSHPFSKNYSENTSCWVLFLVKLQTDYSEWWWCRLLTAKSWSARRAFHQAAFMGSYLTICQTYLSCSPSGQIWLNIWVWWGREKCLVQRLERGICPKSVLDCGSGIKQSVKYGTQH